MAEVTQRTCTVSGLLAAVAACIFAVAPSPSPMELAAVAEPQSNMVASAVQTKGMSAGTNEHENPGQPTRSWAEAFLTVDGYEPIDGEVPSYAPPGEELISQPGVAVIEGVGAFQMGPTSLAITQPQPITPGQAQAVGANFSVSFDGGNPPQAVRDVVLAAAEQWDNALNETGPVVISFYWENLGSSSLLGAAGPTQMWGGGGLGDGSSYYPGALANTLMGQDLNGASYAEMEVRLNSTVDWHVGLTSAPSLANCDDGDPDTFCVNQTDLYSVVLHELGHGLGFLGSASNHTGSPRLASTVYKYDERVAHNGQRLIDLDSADNLLTSDNISFRLSDSVSQALHAPSIWAQGSSFSHFREGSFARGDDGALMTPNLYRGEAARSVDALAISVLGEIGWPLAATPAAPAVKVTQNGADRTILDVTITPNLGLARPVADTFRIEVLLDGQVVPLGSSVAANQTNPRITGIRDAGTYQVRVVPVRNGQDGQVGVASVAVDLAGPPMKPRLVSAGTGLTPLVAWQPPLVGKADTYVVQAIEVGTGGGWTTLATTGASSAQVSLPRDGVYQFRVSGQNALGSSAYAYSIPKGQSDGVMRPVPLDGQLFRLYQAYFLRGPDRSGFQYWLSLRSTGTTLSSVSQAFADSGEFASRYGSLNDEQFVDLVYRNVLGRSPDAGGRSYWVGLLQSGATRGTVMAGFSESSEYITKTGTVPPTSATEAEIYRLYVAFFLRQPDSSGANYWSGVRSSGVSLSSIAAAFAASPEFQARYGPLGDAEFVDLVYNNVLGRPSDRNGSAYWRSFLAAGESRGAMMTGFSESAEFVSLTGTIR